MATMMQVQSQGMQPLTTAHLAQTMSLLVLSNQELRERVLQELNENPALELLDQKVCPNCQRRLSNRGPCPICSLALDDDGPIVFLSPRDSYRPSGRTAYTSDDGPPEREPAAPEDLAIHVLQQLASEIDPDDRPLAAYIIASLDEDGFIQDAPPILARTTRTSLDRVKNMLSMISHVDPPGLATEGPRQALLAQLDLLEGGETAELARRMVSETFNELGRRDFSRIAEALDVRPTRVKQVFEFIQENLNPYPGRSFWSARPQGRSESDPNVYHEPDIQITQNHSQPNGPLMVEIFAPVSGWLRISPAFKQALERNDLKGEWAEHLERAALFVKCMQQRGNTMRRLMKILVKTQRDFILNGDRHLNPMTRAEISEMLDVHESTVSRAVSDKAVALPDGRIIPLARFFDRSLPARDCIKEIVATEVKPLTDDQIASRLEKRFGIEIARRTVAKYRNMEGILPARLRHDNGNGRSTLAHARA